jgi:hypothetical protein
MNQDTTEGPWGCPAATDWWEGGKGEREKGRKGERGKGGKGAAYGGGVIFNIVGPTNVRAGGTILADNVEGGTSRETAGGSDPLPTTELEGR